MDLGRRRKGRCIPCFTSSGYRRLKIVYRHGVSIDATPWAQRVFNTLRLENVQVLATRAMICMGVKSPACGPIELSCLKALNTSWARASRLFECRRRKEFSGSGIRWS